MKKNYVKPIIEVLEIETSKTIAALSLVQGPVGFDGSDNGPDGSDYNLWN